MKPTRLAELDALRGLAALAVVIFHTQDYWNGKAFTWFNWGYLCVDLFFILSGIVLTVTYEGKIQAGRIGFGQFLRARFARMAPLHWAALLFTAGCYFYILNYSEHARAIFPWDASLYGFVMSALFLQNSGLMPEATWNPVAWSISAEMTVNVLWFWLLRSGRASTGAIWAILVAAIVTLYFGWSVAHGRSIGVNFEQVYWVLSGGVLRCIIGFAIGVLIARQLLAKKSEIAVFGPVGVNVFSVVVVAAIALSIWKHSAPGWSGLDYLTALVIMPALVIASLSHGSFLRPVLRLKVLGWLGERSYSIYLVHWPMLAMVPFFMYWAQWPVVYPWIGIGYTAAVLMVSEITYRTIEMPFRAILRGERRNKPAQMASSIGAVK